MTAARPPLRVALLLDGERGPAWVRALVATLREATDIALVLAVLCDPAPCPPRGRFARGWQNRHRIVYEALVALDAARYARSDDALWETELAGALGDVPRLRVRPDRTASEDVFPAEDVRRIGAYDLDVVLRLGFRRPHGLVLATARHGLWSLQSGQDTGAGRPPAPAGFREVVRGDPATGIELRVLRDAPARDAVLARGFTLTDSRSIRCNRSELAWKGASLVLPALRGARSIVEGRDVVPPGTATLTPARPPQAPGNGEALGAALRLGGRALSDVVRGFVYFEQWALAYAAAPPSGHLPAPKEFRELLPPRDTLWADPFPFEHGGRQFLFFEEARRDAVRAHLSVMERLADGRWSTPRRVLERPYHLSYPFVFRWQGQIYLLPETSENRTVELYRCESFPDRWVFERILLEGVRACDATLHEADGRWWMFVAMAPEGARMFDALHVFHADTPLGPWSPIDGNPVSHDVRCARPAGRLFQRDGAWIRPAQDGSGRYGRAIRFQRVLRLDLSGFAETEDGMLLPGWAPDVLGTHTWNTVGALTVLDFIKRRPRFW